MTGPLPVPETLYVIGVISDIYLSKSYFNKSYTILYLLVSAGERITPNIFDGHCGRITSKTRGLFLIETYFTTV